MILCHIGLAHEWDAAAEFGLYDRSTYRTSLSEVGFIHSSDSHEQAGRVARYLYREVEVPLVLLEFTSEALVDAGLRVLFEPASPDNPASEKFPHIYGGPIPVSVVSDVRRFDTVTELIDFCER
ncbi:MAG TPA: DUF952 domain-containing protein [Propionibacteriaceae bacterium]|nr:DUF952 domain-containing protein [Propionibacteriaceae bacterium]